MESSTPKVHDWQTKVLHQPAAKLPTRAKMVACVLAEHMNWETAACDPGMARIARMASMSEKTARGALRVLRSQGFLTIEFRKNERGQSTNRYLARLPPWLRHD